MRRLLLVVLVLMSARASCAAQYVTELGDTIQGLSRYLGHTPYQIKRMNDLEFYKNDELLEMGTTIIYISQDDIASARRRIEELAEQGGNRGISPWKELLADLDYDPSNPLTGVKYSPGSRGLTWEKVLAFARQWREMHPPVERKEGKDEKEKSVED